jgi:hypothetical protein
MAARDFCEYLSKSLRTTRNFHRITSAALVAEVAEVAEGALVAEELALALAANYPSRHLGNLSCVY